MRLSKPPAQIRLGDVIRDTENDLSLVECFAGNSSCMLLGSCRLAGVLSGALDQFMSYLDQFTLADILPGEALTMPPRTCDCGDNPPDATAGNRDGFVRIVPRKATTDSDQTGSA